MDSSRVGYPVKMGQAANENDLLPAPGIEPGPPGWKPEILTTRPCGRWRGTVWTGTDHRSSIICATAPRQQASSVALWYLFCRFPFQCVFGQRQMVPLRVGFEPTREDPIWFLVKRLNHSAIAAMPTVSVQVTRTTSHRTTHPSKGTARIWTGDLLFTRQAL